MFNSNEEEDIWGKMYVPHLDLAFKKGVLQGLGQIVSNVKVDDVFTEAVQRLLKVKAYEHAAQAVGTTKDVLQNLIGNAIEQGQGTEALGRAIREEFDGMARVRGLRIARTEMTDTINEATQAALHAEGAQAQEWSTVIDGRERDTHHEANGQIVGINELFKVGGDSARYPGDDNLPPESRINCRCTILAAGLPEDRRRELGQDFLRAHGSLERNFMVDLRKAFLLQRDRIISRLPA